MGDQRICISKQTTFISLIIFLLLGYVFFAYWTMINKTNTNSRASAPTLNNQIPKSAPANLQMIETNEYSFTLGNDGTIQLKNKVNNNIHENSQYEIYINKSGKLEYVTSFKANSVGKNTIFNGWTTPDQGTKVTVSDLQNDNKMYLYEVN